MKKHNPYKLPPRQIWTDLDLAKWASITFIVGFILGYIL
jgi:hypothetical protein